MPNHFEHQLFISYSHEDKEWALRLAEDLGHHGISVFIDRDLRAGANWNAQLQTEIVKSQHIVVLHSPHSAQSNWVKKELGVFTGAVWSQIVEDDDAIDRRLFCVVLDDRSGKLEEYAHTQFNTDLLDNGVYAAGFEQLDDRFSNVWQHFVSTLSAELESGDPSHAIPVALVTMKQQDVAELNPDRAPPGGQTPELEKVLEGLGIAPVNVIQSRYGPNRHDWKPFGGNATIQTLLNQLIGTLNRRLNSSYRLSELNFLSMSYAMAEDAVKTLETEFSIVVIDPLALYCPAIESRYRLLNDCFRKRNCLVLVLPPFAISDEEKAFNDVVRLMGAPFFNRYFNPTANDGAGPLCDLRIKSDAEMQRVALATLINLPREEQKELGIVWTEFH